jgi:enoyl-CoA hydratase/carnithine racemase
MTQPETIRVDVSAPGIAVVTLHRPERLNAMTPQMLAELSAVAGELDADHGLRVVVLTGAGRGFCSGYDLEEAAGLAALTPAGMMDRQRAGMRAVLAFRELRQPVIAAINGPAVGGGLSLALAADIRLAADGAILSAAFVRIGMTAGDLGCSWQLPRIVGTGLAAELMLTGRKIDAAEASRIGLVNRVVPGGELMSEAMELAGQIAANSPMGVALTKSALHANAEIPSLRAAMELENRGQVLATRAADMPEALAAFREGRPARFTGR